MLKLYCKPFRPGVDPKSIICDCIRFLCYYSRHWLNKFNRSDMTIKRCSVSKNVDADVSGGFNADRQQYAPRKIFLGACVFRRTYSGNISNRCNTTRHDNGQKQQLNISPSLPYISPFREHYRITLFFTGLQRIGTPGLRAYPHC